MVDTLSDMDITKHEKIYEMNFIYCLDILAYRKEKNKWEEFQRNKMLKK